MKKNHLNIIELFAGSQSFSRVAEKLGCNTFTTDINDIEGIDYVCDILQFKIEKVPFLPDVIWASPDCSTWGKPAGKLHFDSRSLKPKTEKAKTAFKHIDKMLEVISYFLQLNPGLKYYIENPVGRLRWVLQPGSLFSSIPRIVVIDQCQYGREHQKTTHIFTNDFEWRPRPRCPGRPDCKHRKNIKNKETGSRSGLGTMDNLRYYERAKIPVELCSEIINSNKSRL